MHALQPLLDAEYDCLSELTTYLKPNASAIRLNTSSYPSKLSSPFVTSVSFALKPSTLSASSSLPMHTSTYFIRFVITFLAFSLDQSFLRKLRSTDTVTFAFLAAINAASVSSIAASDIAGVIPVKWNQSASLKISSKLKSETFAVEIELCARSYTTLLALIAEPVSRK